MKRISCVWIGVLAVVVSSMAFAGESPASVEGATTVDATKAKALFDEGALFVDPRREAEYEAGRIPDAVSLELKKVFSEQSLAEVMKKGEQVVFYCNGPKCPRAYKSSAKAVTWGYSQVYYFRDGFPAWKAAGYPVE